MPIASTPSARALDFQHDATADCRELKFLDVVDECTREALAIELRRTIDADATVAVLERLVAKRGAPTNLRADNGPGLTARILREWCEAGSTDTACIDPGAPWQKAWVESLNARLRDEALDVEAFSTLAEVRFLGVRVARGLQQRAFPLGASHDVAEPIRCQLAANRKDERISQPRARRRGGGPMNAVRLSATLGSVPDCTTFSYVHGSMAKAETTTNGSPAAALAGSDELARLLLDSTGEGIYVIDTKGDCTFANPACARLLGYDGEADLLGKNMHELMHHTRPNGDPYPNEECRVYVAVLQRQGTRVDDEVLWRKDGSSFPAEYSSYPMESDGELVGCVVTFMDISERIEVMDLNRSLMEMSTPVTQVWDKLLLLPLVGIIDTKRARDIMSAMLSEISETRARVFILDISGVGVIDTAVANHLIQITKATSLMGCDCIVSGVSPAIAQTIVELGIDVGSVQTTATMQDALVGAFERLGAEIREIV